MPFSYKNMKTLRKGVEMSVVSQFLDVTNENESYEIANWLKFELYYILREMEVIIRHIFISVIMDPNLIYFQQKLNLELC